MPTEVLTAAIDELASGRDLSAERAEVVLTEVMRGRASEVQAAAFLIALRTKGETVPELIGMARAMRALATPVETAREDLIDTCGTGGGPSTFNISTVAALVAAAAGCAVAKHGNRSNTSRCGSADLLEALGVRIDLDPEAVGRCIDEVGFGFMFAPRHHAAMANVIGVRRELGVRTVFNFLGPLTNPAGARRQVLGVADRAFQEAIAEALAGLGSERAWVVSADDGLDEISIAAPTRVIEVAGGEISEHRIDPTELNLASAAAAERPVGGSPEENAEVAKQVLAGEPGPARDLVLVNAAAAILVAGVADDLDSAITRAAEAVDTGAAREVLERLIAMTAHEAGVEGASEGDGDEGGVEGASEGAGG